MYQNELLDGINLCSAQVRPEHSRGSITSPYNWPSEGVITMKQVKFRNELFNIDVSAHLIVMGRWALKPQICSHITC